ncbi:enoyl-CoA hydratase/isomerase family protein [Brevibacterium ihuae]|uniref:enoyl-CoA hydratase/isomerase family protein n=1 Tax=Brevibacterium ihuae TaxID=1631743 RepID=UPI000C75E19A|nr:enoyl-CoA hydratase/isomerase family protein [Brevibacterium ihuae]
MTGVELERTGAGVAVIRFLRPEKRNALRFVDLDAFEASMVEAAADGDIRALVITGSGGSFCAGIDLSDLAGRSPEERGRPESRAESLDRWKLISFPKPVVVAVDGPAVGMGVEITCQADIRIGSPDAVFAWNFGARGLVPDMGVSPVVLPAIVGLPTALDLLFSGRRLPADEALRCGYLSEIADDPVVRAVELAGRLSQLSPFALKHTKDLVYRALLGSDDHFGRHDAALQACFDSDDHHEGVASFLEKRAPQFAPAAFPTQKKEGI